MKIIKTIKLDTIILLYLYIYSYLYIDLITHHHHHHLISDPIPEESTQDNHRM